MGRLRNGLPAKTAGLRPADSRGRLSPHSDSDLSNRQLIQRFESDLIQEDSFHHGDHVRLAFAYLCEYPALQALEKFCIALKRFAAARGKARLYHETITHAYFFLIRERMARRPAADWEEFSQRNPDLLVWKGAVLSALYRQETLDSDVARHTFVLPDRAL